MRGQTLRLSCFVAAAATVVLAFMASSAAAAPLVQHYHFSFTCMSTPGSPADPNDCVGPFGPTEIDPELCDIPGTNVDSQSGNVQVFADSTMKVEWQESYVFTSALTGKSIESLSNEQFTTNRAPIDNGDGTVSFVFAFKGLEQQLKLPNGPVLVRDAGPVTFTLTVDAATGDFVSFTVSEQGPHPITDSGGNFCQFIVPALS
jgi:hypothetical protein